MASAVEIRHRINKSWNFGPKQQPLSLDEAVTVTLRNLEE
jgi:hypothetical protein